MIINCDIGERGAWHPSDHQLMNYIDMANIACGGHAGDPESISVFTGLARKKGILISAHLSYPDKQFFGRLSLAIPLERLLTSLNEQLEASQEKERVKLHGALYNDCNVNERLAESVAEWFLKRDIKEVVTPSTSMLAKHCRRLNLRICEEAFAERRYELDNNTGQLTLRGRHHPDASIHDLEEALIHSLNIFSKKKVKAFCGMDKGQNPRIIDQTIEAKTICIHSDSEIALPLASRLSTKIKEMHP